MTREFGATPPRGRSCSSHGPEPVRRAGGEAVLPGPGLVLRLRPAVVPRKGRGLAPGSLFYELTFSRFE